MNEPTDYDITIRYKADADAETVTPGELRLLRAYLPGVLQELAAQIQREEE